MPNRSEINPTLPLRKQSRDGRTRPTVRSELLFAGALAAVVAVAAASSAILPPDLVMPVVATALLVCAAALGLIGWRRGDANGHVVSCRDVAGALTLIGAFAANAIEPEQLIRLLVSH